MKLKGLHFADVAEIEEAVADEIKRVQKEELMAAFQKLYNHTKICVYAIKNNKKKKKKVYDSDFLKKSVLKLVDHTVYVRCGFRNSLLINNVCHEHNEMNTMKCRKYLVDSYRFIHTKLNLQVLKTEEVLNVHCVLLGC
jgi:hypothetical protein